MATVTTPQRTTRDDDRKLVEMSWDPITRIVGSLGIYTKIDFANRQVAECHSTSSIFRGYSIFMKGKDPRDAHFITSRICGICGDNHATCACLRPEHGLRRPPAGHGRVDHQPRRGGRVHVRPQHLPGQPRRRRLLRADGQGDQPRRAGTRPSTPTRPHADLHGYRTIADIMRALNPFTGEFYREALQMSRLTREMFCLMEGRHVHPSTLYPGGVGTVPTAQLFTDYLVRLMKYVEFMKKVVPLHDDLFDFFYEALPGYEEVGQRRVLLGCWGSFNDPDVCDYTYKNMNEWGRAMFVTPGVVVDGKLVTTDLVDINLGIRILLGSSFYDDWEDGETFVKHDPLGNPVDQRHPWNQTTTPRPQKRDFDGKYTWVMSPRWLDKRTGDHLALDTGGGPLARLWATALAGLVDIGYIKATGHSVKIYLPKTAMLPEVEFEWKIPKWSNAIERDRARTYFQAYAAAAAPLLRRAGAEGAARRPDQDLDRVQGARRGDRLRLPRGGARRALAPRGDPRRQDRQLPPLSADALERQPARRLRHARPLRGRGAEHADLRGERAGQVQGHRHHAGGAQLRPVPAVRRPHVPGQRQGARRPARADVRRADVTPGRRSRRRLPGGGDVRDT